jgi:hypothetical protein
MLEGQKGWVKVRYLSFIHDNQRLHEKKHPQIRLLGGKGWGWGESHPAYEMHDFEDTLGYLSVFISWDFAITKYHKLGGLKREKYCFTVLEARSLKSRCPVPTGLCFF